MQTERFVFPGADGQNLSGPPRFAGYAAARLCIVRALLHLRQGRHFGQPHRRRPDGAGHRHYALRFHRPGLERRRIRQHAFQLQHPGPAGRRRASARPRPRSGAADRTQSRRRRRAGHGRPRAGSQGGRCHRRSLRAGPCAASARTGSPGDRDAGRGRGDAGRPSLHHPAQPSSTICATSRNRPRASPRSAGRCWCCIRPKTRPCRSTALNRPTPRRITPKSFVALDRADHLLTRRSDADYVAALLATWAGRYLPAAVEAEIAAPPPRHRNGRGNPHGRFNRMSASASTGCWPMSRSRKAASTPAPVPMISCWPGSAPAPR